MNYNGVKLKEVEKPQVFDPPQKMVVWNNGNPQERTVLEVLHNGVAITSDHIWYNNCALLPEKPAQRRATNRELAKWLAQGNGECCFGTSSEKRISANFGYGLQEQNTEVCSLVSVRKWDDTEWNEPTVDYMGIGEGL